MLPYEENRETITRGGRIKRTYNLAFDQIESESSAKRARWTIPCQAEGSGEDVATMGEDVRTEERKDQFLRTVERLLKPSARKRHVIGSEKFCEKRTGLEKVSVVDETKWPGDVRCCGKTFSRGGSFRYHCGKKTT